MFPGRAGKVTRWQLGRQGGLAGRQRDTAMVSGDEKQPKSWRMAPGGLGVLRIFRQERRPEGTILTPGSRSHHKEIVA